MDTKAVFSGLSSAKVFERGVYLNPGNYTLQIENCLVKETRKSGNGFIVEMTVLSADGEGANPVGSKATWFQSLKDKDVAFGAIKEALYAFLGYDYSTQKEEIAKDIDPNIESLIEEAITKNALKGSKVGCTVKMKKTQKGLDFSQHHWSPSKG